MESLGVHVVIAEEEACSQKYRETTECDHTAPSYQSKPQKPHTHNTHTDVTHGETKSKPWSSWPLALLTLLLLLLCCVVALQLRRRSGVTQRLTLLSRELDVLSAGVHRLQLQRQRDATDYYGYDEKTSDVLLTKRLRRDANRRLRRNTHRPHKVRIQRYRVIQRHPVTEDGGHCKNCSWRLEQRNGQVNADLTSYNTTTCQFRVKKTGTYIVTLQLSSFGENRHSAGLSTCVRKNGECIMCNKQRMWHNATAHMSQAVMLQENDILSVHKGLRDERIDVNENMSFMTLVKLR